jgi:hypothetical protein
MWLVGELLASWEREKKLQGSGERGESDGVKLTNTDKKDILGGTLFLLLLAIALFLSAFL